MVVENGHCCVHDPHGHEPKSKGTSEKIMLTSQRQGDSCLWAGPRSAFFPLLISARPQKHKGYHPTRNLFLLSYLGCLGDSFWQALCRFVQAWGLSFLEFPSPCLKKKDLSSIMCCQRGDLFFQTRVKPRPEQARQAPHHRAASLSHCHLKSFRSFFVSSRQQQSCPGREADPNGRNSNEDNFSSGALALLLTLLTLRHETRCFIY